MIDPLFQEKLMSGLRDAVTHFNNGLAPTAAVTKAACDCKFNPEQATRLAETFNTARTIYHFDKNATSENKGNAFVLADPAEVVVNLFGPKQAEKKAELRDYRCYDQVPVDHTLADIDISFSKKANEMDDLRADNQGYRLRKLIATYRTMAEDAQSKAAMANITADKLLEDVAQTLKYAYAVKGNDPYSRLIFSLASPEYKPVLDKLASFMPSYFNMGAAVRSNYGAVIEDRDITNLKQLVKRAKDLLEQSAEMTAIGIGVEKDAQDLDGQFTALFMTGTPAKAEGEVTDFFTDTVKNAAPQDYRYDQNNPRQFDMSPIPQEEKDNKAKNKDKGVGGSGSGSGSGSKSILGQTTFLTNAPGSLYESAMKGLGGHIEKGMDKILEGDVPAENKRITARINNLHRSVMLEDFMSNDPVLRDVDPQQVTSAYQAIMQLAPNVSLNKEVVRAILRQTVHATAISPFDAGSFTTLEKAIRENAGTMPPVVRKDTK